MKRKASITVFLAMMITCFFSSIFAFLEAARVSALKANSQLSTMQAADTVLASYQGEVWEAYHLLFWEIGDEEEVTNPDSLGSLQREAIEGNLIDSVLWGENYYLLQVHLRGVTTSAVQLATDDGGIAFREQAAQRMTTDIGEAAIRAIINRLTGAEESQDEDLEDTALSALESLTAAQEALSDIAQSEANASAANVATDAGGGTADTAANASGGTTDTTANASGGTTDTAANASGGTTDTAANASGGTTTDSSADAGGESTVDTSGVTLADNPLSWIKSIKKNGVLALVMAEEEVSSKAIQLDTCIEHRTLETGNLQVSTEWTSREKVLFYLYLDQYFLDASESEQDHGLDYELEYMIAGKSTDKENLKAVVKRLLLLREAANLAFLETNVEKQEEAEAVAVALAALVLQPELEPVLKQGILAAWAYAESISDVRILLEGGSVSLVKSQSQWHTDLFSLASSVYAVKGEEQTTGLSYTQYLLFLLWATEDETLADRAMDMVEKNTGVAMDRMLARGECSYLYEASSLFWNFVTLGDYTAGTYQFENQGGISFLAD